DPFHVPCEGFSKLLAGPFRRPKILAGIRSPTRRSAASAGSTSAAATATPPTRPRGFVVRYPMRFVGPPGSRERRASGLSRRRGGGCCCRAPLLFRLGSRPLTRAMFADFGDAVLERNLELHCGRRLVVEVGQS